MEIIAGNIYFVCDSFFQEVVRELEKTAKKVIKLIRLGIKFTPTQPDVNRIEELMLRELRSE